MCWLLAAFWETYIDAHQYLCPWAAWLMQQHYAYMWPRPQAIYVLAGGTGLVIGLYLWHDAQPVALSECNHKCAFSAKMYCEGVIVIAPEQLCTTFASSWDIELYLLV